MDSDVTSGQIAIDPTTQQVVPGDVAAQTERVLRNLSEILEAAGSGSRQGRWFHCVSQEHE